jgi:hypothetical protein
LGLDEDGRSDQDRRCVHGDAESAVAVTRQKRRAHGGRLGIRTIKSLSLNAFGKKGLGVALFPFLDPLKTNMTLSSLDVTNNQIGDAAVERIIEVLEVNHPLVELPFQDRARFYLVRLLELSAFPADCSVTELQCKAARMPRRNVRDNLFRSDRYRITDTSRSPIRGWNRH